MKAGTTQSVCKRPGCGLLTIPIAGHRKKEYCSQACRQMDYRNRKATVTKQELQQLREQLDGIASPQREDQRITELEKKVDELETELEVRATHIRKLQAHLKFEEQVQTDTQVRHFKTWLRKHPHPTDMSFSKRLLADTRLPQHASRAIYEAKLRACGYSAEDVFLFRDMWLTLILEQS